MLKTLGGFRGNLRARILRSQFSPGRHPGGVPLEFDIFLVLRLWTPILRSLKKSKILSFGQAGVRTGALLLGLFLAVNTACSQAPQPPSELELFIEKIDAQLLRLRWSGTGPRTLQQKRQLNAAQWTDVLTTVASTTEVAPRGDTSFFRVRKSNQEELGQPKEATPATREANAAVLSQLPFNDQQDFADAERGLIARPSSNVITNTSGGVVWNLEQYAFLTGDPPPSVNPSLWRQARLNMNAGLFKVVDRIYQVRGLDLANMTLIQGDSGWIVIDPLTCAETAAAALALVHEHLPVRPVVAVIFTHSHVDHFGGVKGVVSQADVDAGRVQVIAPAGFTEHAVSENVFAGNAMSRRAQYMYAPLLARTLPSRSLAPA